MGITNATMSIIGATVGGLFSSIDYIEIVFLINALTFLASAFFISKIPQTKTTIPNRNRRIDSDFKSPSLLNTIKNIYQSEFILNNIILGMTWGISGGVYLVVLPFYGKEIYGTNEEGIAIIYAIQGLGVLLGCLISGEVKIKAENNRRLFFLVSYLLQAACFILFAYSSNIIIASLSLLLMRIFSGLIVSLDNTLIQANAAPSAIGKILSFHYSVYGLVMQFSIFLSGVFIKKVGLVQLTSLVSWVNFILVVLIVAPSLVNRLSLWFNKRQY